MGKKLAFLLSGGKDSLYAAYLAKQMGYELECAITIVSKNQESYMFHTPSILKTQKQCESMEIPLILQETFGEKEKELDDLTKAIKQSKEKYKIEGIITGAIESVYQASRIQKICNELDLECFNPLWQKSQNELLIDLIKNNFEVIVIGAFAYPFDQTLLGRTIDESFTKEMSEMNEKYKINPAGEGGEFETFVLNCPLFKKPLKVTKKEISGENHSWKMEIELK